ncbi:toll-like receptor 4 [Dermacentor silvarum]|uniref:toll-like receptor 4 n=1 Tax=Dermacentor silvarum TaxID=543639 RepID=UPI0021016324|nr:toll-like receptor 4 [Dermacentor silvarum]
MAEDHRSTQSLKILLGVSTILTALLASGLDGIKLPCPVGRECPQELLPLPHCNASQLADGRVEALCKILIKAPPLLFFIPSDPEVMTLDELLISDVPLAHNEVAVMSLTRVHVKKWDDFPLSSTNRYDCFISNSSSLLEHVALYSFMVFVRQLELSVTFPKPVKIAIANCSKAQESSKVHCDVYGFKRRFINNDSLPAPMKKFPSIALTLVLIYQWNVEHAVTSKINVTFSGRVKSIPSVALQIIAPFRFTRLVLYRCNFKEIRGEDIPLMRYLKQLDFVYAPITRVHANAFDLIPDIENISLIGTNLAFIPEGVFKLNKLRRLNMAATVTSPNGTFRICPGICKQTSSLLELILAGTTVEDLRDGVFCVFRNLQFLDLSRCSIKVLYGSPFTCLWNLRELDMQSNQIVSISAKAYAGLKRLEILNLRNNKISTLSGVAIFGNLGSIELLDVSFNQIKSLEHFRADRTSVRFLDLSHNFISNWRVPLFSLMHGLRTLVLSSNLMYTIDSRTLQDIQHVETINLSDNPWDCGSCLLNNLHVLLNSSAKRSANEVVCREPERYANLTAINVKWNSDICGPVDFYAAVWVPLLFTTLAITVISYGLYTKRWYMMYALLYLRVKIKNYKRQSHSGRFMWDAFLCYHISDASWTRNVLLAKLESPPMRYRVCVAERDFIPGIPITENICRCISQSRVSLFVINAEFCRSRWCMFEMMLAQHRLFESERDEHIVFIKKGPIDESEITPMLSYLITSRTYIDVPQSGSDERLQDIFWLQLQVALQQ